MEDKTLLTANSEYVTSNDIIKKHSIEISDKQLIIELSLLLKSLSFTIIDISQMIPIIYVYDASFEYFTEKDANLSGLQNITKTFDYLKSLIDQGKFSVEKQSEEVYLLCFKYLLFNEEKTIEINVPRQKYDEQEQNKKISVAINKLDKNFGVLEKKMNSLEAKYQKNLLIQNEKLGLDDVNDIKPLYSLKNEENNIVIEIKIIKEKIEISFIENKNILEEKYSIKLSLEELCLKDEYFSIMKNINSLFDFIKGIFEKGQYSIIKQEKEDKYLLEINFISGINERKIEFDIVKNPFSVVESIKQYTRFIEFMTDKMKNIDKSNENSEQKITELTSQFDQNKSEVGSNLKTLNDNITANQTKNDEKVTNITNDLNNFKTEINKKIAEITDTLQNKIKAEILNMSHPIGSFYWSQENKDPSTIFGGKWEPIKGKFLFAVDDKHAVGSSGGQELVTLTVEELPNHGFGLPKPVCAFGNVVDIQTQGGGETKKVYENVGNITETNKIGGGKPINNMPPYIAAFCWKRIG